MTQSDLDYGVQLRLLEQQNKKRLLAAMEEEQREQDSRGARL